MKHYSGLNILDRWNNLLRQSLFVWIAAIATAQTADLSGLAQAHRQHPGVSVCSYGCFFFGVNFFVSSYFARTLIIIVFDGVFVELNGHVA